MKVFHRVVGESRRKKFRGLLVCLLIFAVILTISAWIVVEIMNANGMLVGFPWEGVVKGEPIHLIVLFVLSFSSSTLYVVYYKGVREVSKTAHLYLLAILAVVILARVIFRF
ncbi:MAG: hypothetical protein QXF56_05610 [Candidatus Micrarchaeia archaeon]